MKRSEFLKLSALGLAAIQTGAVIAKKTYEDFKPEPLEDLHRKYGGGHLHVGDCLLLPNQVVVIINAMVQHKNALEVQVIPLNDKSNIGHLPKGAWIIVCSFTYREGAGGSGFPDADVFRLYQHVSETRAGHSTTLLLECNKTKKEST